MMRHMLLELPMLVCCGALAGLLSSWRPLVARLDAHGLAGLTAANLAAAYWMIPRALELSLHPGPYLWAKYASLIAVGVVLPGSLRRAGVVVQIFFVGNLCAMMAIAGMVYQDAPDRLCNAYLVDDQNITGGGLVGLALGVAGVWCSSHYRELLGGTDEEA
jgi:hypothetical protein